MPNLEVLKFGSKSLASCNTRGIIKDSITTRICPDQNFPLLPCPEICSGEKRSAKMRSAEQITPTFVNRFENIKVKRKMSIGEITQNGSPLIPPGLKRNNEIALPPESGNPVSSKIWVG